MKSQNSLRLLLVILFIGLQQYTYTQSKYPKPSKRSYQSLMEEANNLLSEKKDTLAARKLLYSLYQQAERKNALNHYAEALGLYGQCFVRQKEVKKGLKRISRGIDKLMNYPSFPYKKISKLYQVKALLLAESSKYSEAGKTLLEDIQNWEDKNQDFANWDYVHSLGDASMHFYNADQAANAYPLLKKAFKEMEALDYTDVEYTMSLIELNENVLLHAGKERERIIFGKESIKIVQRILGEDDLKLVSFYESTGFLNLTIGEVEEALKYLDKALYIVELNDLSIDEQKALDVSSIYALKGQGFSSLNRYEEAIWAYEKALELADIPGSEVDGWTSRILGELGSIYESLGKFDLSFSYIQKADSLLQEIYEENPNPNNFYHQFRNIHFHYCRHYAFTGDYVKSNEHGNIILNQYSKPEAPWENNGVYYLISHNFDRLGQIDSALYYNQKAIQAFIPKFEASNLFELPKLETLPSLSFFYDLLNDKLGYLILKSSSLEDKKESSDFYENTLEVVEYIDQFHLNNLVKTSDYRAGNTKNLIKESIPVYNNGIKTAYERALLSKSEKYLEKVFQYAQKKKAQGLLLNTLSNEAVEKGYVTEEYLEKEKQLLEDIYEVERQIFISNYEGEDEDVKNLENTLLFDYQSQYENLLKKIEQQFPKYLESKYAVELESVDDIQELLVEDEALVEYVFLDSFLFTFVLTKDEPLSVLKTDWKDEKNGLLQELVSKLRSNSWYRKSHKTKFIESSYELYQAFIEPIIGKIEGKKRLIIIGEGVTHYLPFEMLVSSNLYASYEDLDYLIKHFEISYHYSSNLFAKARRSQRSQMGALLAFAPVYEEEKPLLAELSNTTYFNEQLRAYTPNGSFAPLPESEREVQTIQELFDAKVSEGSELLLRSAANKSSLIENMEKNYQCIHIAGHSFADVDHPKFSGIACWKNDQMYGDDVLFSAEINNLNIKADLVSLSSCESGYGKFDVSEGLLGINRAFLHAGAENVVFTLWKIYDKVSADMMVSFYQGVLEGKNYAKSLREAKLALLDDPETAAPHLWSSFLLIGR